MAVSSIQKSAVSAKRPKQHVWTITFQLMEACNTVAVASTKRAALKWVKQYHLIAMQTSGAVEYGEVVLRKHTEIMANLDRMEFRIRDKGDEVWIDLDYLGGGDARPVQPAMFTLTKLPLDATPDELVDDDDIPQRVVFVHDAPKLTQ